MFYDHFSARSLLAKLGRKDTIKREAPKIGELCTWRQGRGKKNRNWRIWFEYSSWQEMLTISGTHDFKGFGEFMNLVIWYTYIVYYWICQF